MIIIPAEPAVDESFTSQLLPLVRASNVSVSVVLYPNNTDVTFTKLAVETGGKSFIINEEIINDRGSLLNMEQIVDSLQSIAGGTRRGQVVSNQNVVREN